MKRQRHVVYRRSAILSKEDQKDEDDERICTQNGHGPSASTSSHRWTHRPQASSYEPPLERRTRQYTTHAQRYNRYNRQR